MKSFKGEIYMWQKVRCSPAALPLEKEDNLGYMIVGVYYDRAWRTSPIVRDFTDDYGHFVETLNSTYQLMGEGHGWTV